MKNSPIIVLFKVSIYLWHSQEKVSADKLQNEKLKIKSMMAKINPFEINILRLKLPLSLTLSIGKEEN